jgi:hypothetical protein
MPGVEASTLSYASTALLGLPLLSRLLRRLKVFVKRP